MSWTSRLSLGRFSPFTRTPPNRTEVSDSDFSYITSDDLKQHEREQQQRRSRDRDRETDTAREIDLGPSRDTDRIVLRHKRESYAVHFPAYSIAKGELSIGDVRAVAAKKLGGDLRRVKLIYRGKNLKDDSHTCRSEGLREGVELMCLVGEAAAGSDSDDSDSEEAGVTPDGGDDDEGRRRRRNRNKNKKRREKKKEEKRESGESTPTRSEHLPSANLRPPPSGSRSHSPSSSRAPTGGSNTPLTPIAKLNALRETLQTWAAQCDEFRRNPPADPAKKDYEHKRLGETVLTQVLLKLDAVETEGDEEARKRRKELVREAQAVLKSIDEVVGVKSSAQS